MGSRLVSLAADDPSLSLCAAVVRNDSPRLTQSTHSHAREQGFIRAEDCSRPRVERADVVIDFSSHDGLASSIAIARRFGAALIVGTTGLSTSHVHSLKEAAHEIAVLHTPNTSAGVAVLADAIARMSTALGTEYRCLISETHHVKKKDAPSGTALRLAAAVRAGRATFDDADIHSIREGEVVGDHTVRFVGPGEVIELTHRATTRDLFALGALRAAKWMAGKPAGWYTMDDVLGLGRR